MFLRFVSDEIHPDSGVPVGVFQLAGHLYAGGEISEIEAEQLQNSRVWFGQNLPRPTRFNRTKSKGHYRRSTKGISWFKDSAEECIYRIREMVAILENHGYQIRMISTDRPGYVVYEDEYQIVAEPFSDTKTS